MKLPAFAKDKFFIDIVVVCSVILVFTLIFLGVYFANSKLNSAKTSTQNTPNLGQARAEKDPTTYFDSVLYSFDSKSQTLNLEMSKNGFVNRSTVTLTPSVKISRVVYDAKTLVITSKETIKSSDLKSGQSLRLFVSTKADNTFDLSSLAEVQVLEGK